MVGGRLIPFAKVRHEPRDRFWRGPVEHFHSESFYQFNNLDERLQNPRPSSRFKG